MNLRTKVSITQILIYQASLFVIFPVLFFITSPCVAQGNETFTRKTFPVESLQYDFLYFRALLEEGHPSLYRYEAKDSVDYYFNQALAEINHPMQEIEFWKILQSIVVKLGSGHTTVRLTANSLESYHNSKRFYLPFEFYIRNDHLFIRKYFALGPFEIGDEVVSIDGNSSAFLLSTFRKLIPGDGYTNAMKDNQLEGAAFQYFYNILIGDKPQYSIVFKSADGIRTNIIKSINLFPTGLASSQSIPGMTWKFNSNSLMQPDSFYHHISHPANIPSTVIVKINSFMYSDYASFHRKLFKYLQKNKVDNLVLDLRNNEGGYANVCMDLLSYLSGKKNKLIAACESVININRTSSITMDGSAGLVQFKHQINGIKTADSRAVRPDKNYFKGKLYLLINGGTFSAASLLAIALKNQVDCTTIGQETGGGKFGTDGELIPTFTLPETNLSLLMPLLWGYSMANGKNDGYGLKPDIEFIPELHQIYEYEAKGTDPFLEELTRIIKPVNKPVAAPL